MEKTLPKNWVETELMSLCEVYTGKKDANFATLNGKYNFFTCAYKPLKSDSYSFEGDVLILPGNGVNVGEVFYFSGKFEAYQRTYIVNEIKIDAKYLFYHFSRYWKEIGSLKQFGSATNYIKIGNFKDYKVQFPPLAEQQRIVAKLDEVFEHLDTLKTRLGNIPSLLKNCKQAILTQAVTGKLTQEWRVGKELGNASGDIFNIDVKNKKTDRVKFIKLNKPKIFIDNKNWLVTQFYNLCILKRGFDLPKNKRVLDGEYVVASAGGKSSKHNEFKIDEGIVVGRSGSVGRVHWIDEKHWPLNTTLYVQDFCGNNKKFVYYYLLTFPFSKYSSSTAVPTLNRNHFVNVDVAIPSLEEQTEIVKRVENLFAKADKIEAQYETLKTKIDSLPQAILAKAFKGELVEQLPTDGDAKDLLEEIQALKASLAKKPKVKKK